jgi:hypothetical protein
VEKEISEIQTEALRKLGRELNEQELQSFLDLKIMEAAFENIDIAHPEELKPVTPKSKE